MLEGYVGTIERDLITGWAADSSAPDDAIDILIYIDGHRTARIACDLFREDLHLLGRYGQGRHGFRFEISPPLSLSRTRQVCVRFARTGEVLPNGSRELGYPELIPILVTAPGRSGTTWMMERLSGSPQVCVARGLPYEVRLIAYWSGVISALSGKPDYVRSTHPDRLEGDGFWAGSNPFANQDSFQPFLERILGQEYFSNYMTDQIIAFSRKVINEFYFRIRDDSNKCKASHFAEKSNNLVLGPRQLLRSISQNAKEIVLVRDPRDLVCSHMSYFQQTFEAAYREVSVACDDLIGINMEPRPDTRFVVYEELVRREDAFAELEKFLGISGLTRGNELNESGLFKAHATSASPQASIERWRRQFTKEQADRCNAAWADFLAHFGYAPT